MCLNIYSIIILIEKFSPLTGFGPTTYQVAVYEADDIPMCHRASVRHRYLIEVDFSLGQLKSAKLKKKLYTIVDS